MKSICLITCYMGPLPNYFSYYLSTCKKNDSIKFVIINDTIKNDHTDSNVRFIKLNMTELNALASKKTGERIQLTSSWKINELKPLFGVIFDDVIAGADFWGWCDLDIIWGKLRNFLTPEILNTYDVFTTKERWTTGHFTLLKNTAYHNTLYKKNQNVIELLNNPVYFAFEECCHRWNGDFYAIEELHKKNLPVSMFDVIKNEEAAGRLKAHFKTVVREHPDPINFEYKNGVMTDRSNGQEFMYYHLITVKKIWRFYIPSYKQLDDGLLMSPYGIRSLNENKVLWLIKRAYSCYRGILKSVKTQGVGRVAKKLVGQ